MLESILKLLNRETGPFVYVACGARNCGSVPLVELLPNARYIGFEPDADECGRLNQNARERYTFFPVAVGKCTETRTLHVTRYRACSSLLRPDPVLFGRFAGCASAITVDKEQTVETVSLQDYLPMTGISKPDFLDLDTQGTELEILRGAEEFLSASVIGIKIEIEFSPIYEDQPLFAEVDSYLRQFGFMLFDLSRNRYRRQDYPSHFKTRGQLVWGDAIYLQNYDHLISQGRLIAAIKLVGIASAYGFHDYGLEILRSLIAAPGGSGSICRPEVISTVHAWYLQWLEELYAESRWVKLARAIARSPLRRLFLKGSAVCGRLASLANAVSNPRNGSSWVD